MTVPRTPWTTSSRCRSPTRTSPMTSPALKKRRSTRTSDPPGALSWPIDEEMSDVGSGDEYAFAAGGPVLVPPRTLFAVGLGDPADGSPHAHVEGTGVHFDTEGWLEVLLR